MQWPLVGRQNDLDHALALVEAGTGIAILGSAGVGKSRLLSELVELVDRSDIPVVRATATQATRSIAFAPFLELLAPTPTEDRVAMLAMALSTLRDKSSQKGLLLAIDDANHLDDSSLGFLIQAVTAEVATVALTARSHQTMSAELVSLWTNGVIERIDLTPLERSASRALLLEVLGEIDDTLDEELWTLAAGNPLILHEVVEGAVNATTLTPGSDGRWSASGPLGVSPRLADLVTSRLAAMPEDVRNAMEVVAVGSPLPLALFNQAVSDRSTLDERGLVTEVVSGGEPMVVPSHPLYGEVLKENLGGPRQRATYRRLVQATVGGDHRIDPLRAAVWQLESGTLISPELALQGARSALVRHDPSLAERLARTLPPDNPGAVLLLGRSLSYQQQFDEAEAVFTELDDAPSMQAELVSARAQNLAFGLGRIEQARDMLAGILDVVSDRQVRGRLMNERAMVSAVMGDFVDARMVTEQVLSDDSSDEMARAAAYVTLTLAQAMTGDCDALYEIIDEALSTADGSVDKLPFAGIQVRMMLWMSLVNAGRISEAMAAVRSLADADASRRMRATLLSMYCLVLDTTGLHDEAIHTLGEALRLYSEADPFGLEPQAKGMLALHRGQLGDAGGEALLEDLVLPVQSPRLTVWVDRGRAWTLVARGDVDAAMEILIKAGEHAVAGEHFVWGCFCLHDAVRLGRPDLVMEQMEELPPMPGAELVANMRSHSRVLHNGDAASLVDVAAKFASYGATLLAAEVWAQAAHLLVETDVALAARCVLLSLACQTKCQGSRTPALQLLPALISARESEISLVAALGRTSPQIAQKLFISVRTVDNHLSSVYRKLGISGREDLQGLLASVLEMSSTDPRNE